jgi:hypothetical protein
MVRAENRSERLVAGNIVLAPPVLNLRDDASEGDSHANAFLPSKAQGARRIARDRVVPARTLRSPTAGIGTELLAHRQKIEVKRHR